MTQKLMGEYEKAAHNYDAGAKALAFTKLKSLQNSASSPRLPIGESRNHLWCDYAMDAALRFSIQDNVDSLAWPTGDMALRDEKEKTFAGWYWQDKTDHDGKLVRLFTPNYFNNIFHFFLQDGLYANLMGNRSTVLKLLGQDEEAQKHLEEAEDFSFDG